MRKFLFWTAVLGAAAGGAAFVLQPAPIPQGFNVVPVDASVLFDSTLVGIEYGGDIEEDTADKLTALTMNRIALGNYVVFYRITSPGGSGIGAMKLAAALRWNKDVPVLISGRCASACAIAVLLAGPTRVVLGPRGQLGLHQSRDPDTGKPMMDVTRQHAAALRKAGVPEKTVQGMLKTPPRDIYWIGQDELMQMNIAGKYVKARPS
jgi:hypothetical protein